MTDYYVDSAATGTGDGLSEVNAFTTIDTAANNTAAGDTVYVKASGTYNELVTIDTAGASGNVIWWVGYTSTITDNGKVTIDGTTSCVSGSVNGNYNCWRNFKFINASGVGVLYGNADLASFYNCEFNSNGQSGISGDNQIDFVNCQFDGNTFYGTDVDNTCDFAGCIFSNNGLEGMSVGQGSSQLYRCLFYGNGAADDDILPNLNMKVIIGCTFDGENTTGDIVASVANGSVMIVDNIFHDATNAVIVPSTYFPYNIICYNHYSSIDTTEVADKEINGVLTTWGNVSAAAGFEDEANDDYTLGGSSAAIDAGIQPGGIT